MPERDIIAASLVLFDLDGTFADTAPDLAAALNRLLDEQGRPALPFAAIRPVASMGGAALVQLGFDMDQDDPRFEYLRERFLVLYLERVARDTRLFPGMETVLQCIEDAGAGWGIVTNKPGWLTDPLMQALGLQERASCIISGDTLAQRKPHPAPLLHACRTTGVPPGESVYVGDAERDMQAAARAGMPAIVAGYGYIPVETDPGDWRAHGLIDRPQALLELLELKPVARMA